MACENNFGTEEQKTSFFKLLDDSAGKKDDIMRVLQKTQEIYGFLPKQTIKKISISLGMPEGEIFGIITFYTQFSLIPKAKYNINVCMGTACFVAEADKILDKICKVLKLKVGELAEDNKWLITTCRCIGCCGIAPVMTINEKVYGKLQVATVEEILKEYV